MVTDSSANRFFSFWGALATFLAFGLLALVVAGINLGGNPERPNPDDLRRTALDSETLATQRELVTTWKKNDDGTYEVPIDVALPKMLGKYAEAQPSEVPVPGTAAAAKAAEAAAAAAAAGAPAEDDAASPEANPSTTEDGAPDAGQKAGETAPGPTETATEVEVPAATTEPDGEN